MNDEEEPFLKRWSRRKQEAKDGPVDAADPKLAPDGEVRALDERSRAEEPPPAPGDKAQDKRELTEADFADVDFEALDYNSDYARFTAPGVPEAIKNKALQKLWASHAVFTTPDPFQDYLGDYTDAAVAVPPGTLKTAYRIGKGFLTDEEVAEWEKLGKPAETEVAASAKTPAGETAAAAAAGATVAGAEPPVSIAAEPADQPEVHALLRQSDAYHAALYPAESNHLVDVATLAAPNVRFLVVRRGGAAVGCGALVVGADGEAELKRMFVVPEARGLKIGSRVLAALEAAAKVEEVRVIRLETGVRQPESLALYRRHGYTERGPFGAYTRDPLSTFFEKWVG
jgi:putative acetyltransferase